MTDAQFAALSKLIHKRAGIYFAANKKYLLETRLSRRLEELEIDNFDQYIMFLSVGPFRNDEFQEMFNRITINETSFFRNEPQLKIFESQFLVRLLEERKATRRLRIWSAACSTGEEPYTLAIQLHRTLGLRLPDWRIEILGTDISEKALVQAQTGIYGTYAMRSTDPLIQARYFQKHNGAFQINPEIQAMVRFETQNLKDTFAARRYGVWDVIFCRNCMIYFDQEMRTHCLKIFYDQLAPDGYLLIGHSETIQQPEWFEQIANPQAFAYARAHPGRRLAARSAADGTLRRMMTNGTLG